MAEQKYLNPRYSISRKDYEVLSKIDKYRHLTWPDYFDVMQMDFEDMGDIASVMQEQIARDPKYHPSLKDHYLYPFPGFDTVTESFSQAWQDLFVLSMLEGKRNGCWLEIGACWPIAVNNTYLLSQFGWTGISIDKADVEPYWKQDRPQDKLIVDNASTINYNELLADGPLQIDYLQVDIDPQQATFELLQNLPHDSYRFSVITYETDAYFYENIKMRRQSREYMQSLGYELVVPDIVTKQRDVYGYGNNKWVPFEDWYVDPNIIPERIWRPLQQQELNGRPAHFLFDSQVHI